MKQYKYISILISCIAISILMGCKSELYNPVGSVGKDVIFTVGALKTKANTTTQNFTENSALGIFALKAIYDNVELADQDKFNIQYNNINGTNNNWTPENAAETLKFLAENQEMNFYAYHPHTNQNNSTTKINPYNPKRAIIYNTPTNQSTLDELIAADLMWGNALECKESDGTVELKLQHVLSKLSFTIMQGEGWGSEDAKISAFRIIATQGLAIETTMDLSTGIISPEPEVRNTEIICQYSTPAYIDPINEHKCEFILIPTNSTDILIEITMDGVDEKFKGTIPTMALEKATQTNIKLNIHRRDNIDIVVDAEILDWFVDNDVELDGI